MWEHHYNRLVRSVMKSGKPARAEVISARQVTGYSHMGSHTTSEEFSWGWNVHLKVVPQNGEPFELQTKMEIPLPRDLVPGTKLQVFYNPRHPESIVMDPANAPESVKDAVVANTIDVQGMLGADTTGMKEAAEQFNDPIQAAAAAAAQARRNFVANRDAQLAERHAEVARVRAEQGDAAADASVAANNQAMIAQVYEGFAKVGLNPGSVRGAHDPPAQTADVESRLLQLQALKASGALDDQEYEKARKRVIENI